MRVFHVGQPKASVACIGFFDGLHRGHRALLAKTLDQAKSLGLASTFISFDPDPKEIIQGHEFDHLMTKEAKLAEVKSLGFDQAIILESDHNFLSLSPSEFIDRILLTNNVVELVCGFDFHFGYKGQGDVDYLKRESNLIVHVIEPVVYGGEKVSSSRIIRTLKDGQVTLANQLLTRPYGLQGKVVHGFGRGKTLGFPTANLSLLDRLVVPKHGVYAGYVYFDGSYWPAMTSIGLNPTFDPLDRAQIEVHIMNDFNQDLYGQCLDFYFLDYLRDEVAFDSPKKLVDQLEKDRIHTQEAFDKYF